jgi:hypothetical protein
MTERTSFYRKLSYLAVMVVLAFPIVWLSLPATATRAGGKLSQLRDEYKLSQAKIGDIDPASETIKLATLGLRGVAVNLLWEKANYYKKTEDWTNLTATLEQLAKLQPNFITFWKFQAWNLTYNVSVEFDDYHDRYYYVRRGIEFLQKGEKYNSDHPQLLWDLGWFIGQKIGRADEYLQYRRLFKADEEFHADAPDRTADERDNWLVGKEWYLEAVDAVDNKGKSMGRKSPRDFYSSPAKSTMNYAEAIEEEGYFEKARRAWIKAEEEWRQFGQQPIEHSTGVKLTLGSQQKLEKEVADIRTKLDEMQPGTRAKLGEEKKAALSAEDRAILDTPKEELTAEQAPKYYELEQKIVVNDREVADRIAKDQPAKANQAQQFASELQRQDQLLQFTINYKRDANYDYWENRAEFEQTQAAITARTRMNEGRTAFRNADLPTAKRKYQEGFAEWRKVIDKYPMILSDDETTGGDLLDFVKRYRTVLEQMDEKLGEDFPLWDVIEKFDREQDFPQEQKEHRRLQGRPLPEDMAPAKEPAPTEAEPEKAAAAAPAESKEKSAEKSELAPKAASPAADADIEKK